MPGKNEKQPPAQEKESVRKIAISATFTAEPLEQSLKFWARELDLPFSIEFAPYNQVFQQLLDPSSLLSKNEKGMNVFLLRFEDWLRDEKASFSERGQKIQENVQDLIAALRSFSDRSSTPYLVCICPASPAGNAYANQEKIFQQMETLMFSELERMSNVYLVQSSGLTETYPVPSYYDPHGDAIGHVPYTSDFFVALGTMIARKLYRIESAPYKVIVLDCDHTLWKGVCGEDGPLGVRIDEPYKELQAFMVEQANAGMLVCLCSKNSEEDVVQVFEYHPEMPLRRNHITSWRINWKPKSENIRSLADELQLGLDSFIFIDDNPVECAEVRANCPEVLSLQLPNEPNEIPKFLKHVWAFDHLKITEEDRRRTTLYQENIKRDSFLKDSLSFAEFLEGLKLQVRSFAPSVDHLSRVAQLTQRTNQFNFTTVRRSEGELQKILQSGALECLCVEVSDRFGDYGLVGVILFKSESNAIAVDSFLLSCRVLGKGVEHQLLAALGQKANERGLSCVKITYAPSSKNRPALDFLDGIGSKYKEPIGDGFLFKLPTEYARSVKYAPSFDMPTESGESAGKKGADPRSQEKGTAQSGGKSEWLNDIARNLNSAEQITKMIESRHRKRRSDLSTNYVAPSSELERSICKIWERVLGIEKVGIHDNFFKIGGQSLLGTRILSRVNQETGVALRLQHLFNASTVALIASLVETLQSAKGTEASAKKLSNGEREVIAF